MLSWFLFVHVILLHRFSYRGRSRPVQLLSSAAPEQPTAASENRSDAELHGKEPDSDTCDPDAESSSMSDTMSEALQWTRQLTKGYLQEALSVMKEYMHLLSFRNVFAFVLLFFGGQFSLTIACVQAFQRTGWQLTCRSCQELRSKYRCSVIELMNNSATCDLFPNRSSNPMELLTTVRDTIASTSSEQQELARRRVSLLVNCIDPGDVANVITSFWTGVAAVLATVRSRIIFSVAIGANVGREVGKSIEPLVLPKLTAALPNHANWMHFSLRTVSDMLGIISSLLMVRVASALNSALQGASILLETALPYIMGQHSAKLEPTYVWGLACFGFLLQISYGLDMPLFVKIPLTPFYILEYALRSLASW
eukprot:gnl/MRDRNA2_/MRDRNA2_73342_c0_seq1.p1 gnl/MRDRNA2_/MRDRNA2_73342_c0~~gnl/MRDRNA2_/MRDRNA2_73342_c0_seq1.p1  ORF type:complete len:367 (+),score=41.36 gnl/MRDRNA2_/MRDRNA2_73342_c0_seq1:77-1177(+)